MKYECVSSLHQKPTGHPVVDEIAGFARTIATRLRLDALVTLGSFRLMMVIPPFVQRMALSASLRKTFVTLFQLGASVQERDCGSPNHGSTVLSKRTSAQIRSPVRVRTKSPVPWRMPPPGTRRYAPNAG